MEKPIKFQFARFSPSLWTHFTPCSPYCQLGSNARVTTNLFISKWLEWDSRHSWRSLLSGPLREQPTSVHLPLVLNSVPLSPGAARRGFSFPSVTGGLSLSRGQNKFETSPPLGLNRPGPNFPKNRHPATPASQHQPSVVTGTGPGVAAPTDPTVTSDPWSPKSTQQTPLQVRVPGSQAPPPPRPPIGCKKQIFRGRGLRANQ